MASLADFDQGGVGDEVEARADCLWLDLEALEKATLSSLGDNLDSVRGTSDHLLGGVQSVGDFRLQTDVLMEELDLPAEVPAYQVSHLPHMLEGLPTVEDHLELLPG